MLNEVVRALEPRVRPKAQKISNAGERIGGTMSGRKIIRGLQEAIDHADGNASVARLRVVRVPEHVDVKAIRQGLKMSQSEFARRFGFSIDSLQNWEQGRRFPDGYARVLLRVIERHPEVVEDALAVG
jgi:putative transcriptional regulator